MFMFVPASPQSPEAGPQSIPFHVICAWPLSGQYGPGSRVLYYVLIATCVLARKAKPLREACLPAALLFPVVAAVHGIVLAALHVDGAVDMDIYGAFQLCAIGILAAPVTAKLSGTYFSDPGRNLIFIWAGIILAGLLSLTVEFFRSRVQECPGVGPDDFVMGTTNCSLVCSVDQGPFSPLRMDATNNIYVVPAPPHLTFGTGTLLASACCIPAILCTISLWNKILKINWDKRRMERAGTADALPENHGAVPDDMHSRIGKLLSSVQIVVICAAVMAILVFGELNFWSAPVRYQTEPITSIGQWAPILATAIAAVASLYLGLAPYIRVTYLGTGDGNPDQKDVPDYGRCSPLTLPVGPGHSPRLSEHHCHSEHPPRPRMSHDGPSSAPEGTMPSLATYRTSTSIPGTDNLGRPAAEWVVRGVVTIGEYMAHPARDRFGNEMDDKASEWPGLPGEEFTNGLYEKTKQIYNQSRPANPHATSSGQTSESAGLRDAPGMSNQNRPESPHGSNPGPKGRSRSYSLRGNPFFNLSRPETRRSSSPSPPHAIVSRPYSDTRGRSDPAPARSNTLEVPAPAHHSPSRNERPRVEMASVEMAPARMAPVEPTASDGADKPTISFS